MPKLPAKRTVSTSTVTPAASKPAKRNVKTTPLPVNALPTTPVVKHTPVAKPAKPAAAVKPSAATTALAADAAAPMPRGLTRDAAGIVRGATNFAVYSDRDTAYLVFIGAVCRANGGKATLRQIHDAGVTRSGFPDRKHFNPHYAGSSKATDIGAINRLRTETGSGYFERSADGNTLTPTALALASKAYLGTN